MAKYRWRKHKLFKFSKSPFLKVALDEGASLSREDIDILFQRIQAVEWSSFNQMYLNPRSFDDLQSSFTEG